MSDKILNTDYYKLLVQKDNTEFNSFLLTISRFNKLNLSFIKRAISESPSFNIIIKIPKYFNKILDEIYSNLYLYIAKVQFEENRMNPELTLGELLIRKNAKKNRKYKVVEINEQKITLKEQKRESSKDFNGPAILYVDRKNIIKEFMPIKRSLKKKSLNNYLQLFSKLNSLDINKDFFPTKFNSVSLFVGSKKKFDNFRNISILGANLYNSIPCYYINRDGNESDTLGIEPLIYFSPSYTGAYQHISERNKTVNKNENKIKVSNIILFDDGFDELQQIISDQSQYKFRIIGICTNPIEKRESTIKYWEWHKEEIDLIDSL